MTFATNLAYPVGDLILLGFALAGLSATGWRPGRGIGLIAAGLLLRAFADFIYLDQITRGSYDGGVLDTAWPAASLLVAAAACVPASRSRREPDWRVFLAPAFFVTTSLGLLVFDHFERLVGSAILLAALAVGVAALRMVTMVRMTVASSRHEAATDALTGLPNRRTLKRDLDARWSASKRARNTSSRCSISTASRGTTTASAIRPATPCSRVSVAACPKPRPPAAPTASAAMSSAS